jgi:putative toxin-antitoxin system antitoxin component (TIGR02293 family)
MLGTSIGVKARNTTGLIAQIEKGLPVNTFDRLKKHLDTTDKNLAGILGIPISTLARRKKAKRFPFAESERIFRVARLFDRAITVFGDAEAARTWLKKPSWSLGDISPLAYARTELGAQEVENLLGRIEDGVFA